MGEHPLIVTLRNRRRELGLSKSRVQLAVGMSRGTFDSREDSGRFGALEQFERWAGFLGFRVVLAPKENETILWS